MANKITLEAVLDASGIQRGVTQAQNSLGVLKGVVDGMLPILSGAVVGNFVKQSFNEFASDEQALNKLSRAVKNAGSDWTALGSRIQRTVGDMQYMTGFTDDELYGALRRMVLSTGDVQKSLGELSTAADVAAAYEMDLTTAASAVAAAMEGNYRKVTMLLPALRDLVKDGMSVVEVMKLIRDTTAGSAGAGMDGAAGSVRSLQIAIDDLKGSIGGLLAQTGAADYIRSIALAARGKFGAAIDASDTDFRRQAAERMRASGHYNELFIPEGQVLRGDQKAWWDAQMNPAAGPSYYNFPGSNAGGGGGGKWGAMEWAGYWANFNDTPGIVKRPGRGGSMFDSPVGVPGMDTGEGYAASYERVKAMFSSSIAAGMTAGINQWASGGGFQSFVRATARGFEQAFVQATMEKAAGKATDWLFGALKLGALFA